MFSARTGLIGKDSNGSIPALQSASEAGTSATSASLTGVADYSGRLLWIAGLDEAGGELHGALVAVRRAVGELLGRRLAQAIAFSPFVRTRLSSFSEAPSGFLSPRSHLLTMLLETLR